MIDEDHRDAARRRLYYHVWPKLGFHEQSKIRPPMIEETAHEPGNIKRNELMDHSVVEALFGEPARGDSACCYQHAYAPRTDSIDQRQDACKLSDAGAVQPDKRTFRPGNATFAPALRQTLSVFLAALDTPREKDGSEWSRRRGQQPINPQTSR